MFLSCCVSPYKLVWGRGLRGCFLVSSLVPYGSYVLYAVLSMSMESQVMPVCRSSSISCRLRSCLPQYGVWL